MVRHSRRGSVGLDSDPVDCQYWPALRAQRSLATVGDRCATASPPSLAIPAPDLGHAKKPPAQKRTDQGKKLRYVTAVLGGYDSEQDPLILMAQGLDRGREHTMRAGRPRDRSGSWPDRSASRPSWPMQS